jgi:hypothetical protein
MELETQLRGSGDGVRGDHLADGKGGTYSTVTSFYKNGSAEGSGSEEMILGGGPGPTLTLPPHALTTDEAAVRGIVRTTEVRVTVR